MIFLGAQNRSGVLRQFAVPQLMDQGALGLCHVSRDGSVFSSSPRLQVHERIRASPATQTRG